MALEVGGSSPLSHPIVLLLDPRTIPGVQLFPQLSPRPTRVAADRLVGAHPISCCRPRPPITPDIGVQRTGLLAPPAGRRSDAACDCSLSFDDHGEPEFLSAGCLRL